MAGLQVTIFSLFLPLLDVFCQTGILKRALAAEILSINLVDYRKFGIGRYKKVDDRPFGGGPGMLIRPEPIVSALESIPAEKRGRVIMLNPQGSLLTQKKVIELSQLDNFSLVCGRYEGFDHRVSEFVDEKISLGSFVLMGGEVAAMAIVEAVARHLPGVLGNASSAVHESFIDDVLEEPQYTRPVKFRGMQVPDVLLSGNHQKINAWKQQQRKILNKTDKNE